LRKTPFFRRKLSKIAENRGHNIDTRSQRQTFLCKRPFDSLFRSGQKGQSIFAVRVSVDAGAVRVAAPLGPILLIRFGRNLQAKLK
jgi:hypothetical protein